MLAFTVYSNIFKICLKFITLNIFPWWCLGCSECSAGCSIVCRVTGLYRFFVTFCLTGVYLFFSASLSSGQVRFFPESNNMQLSYLASLYCSVSERVGSAGALLRAIKLLIYRNFYSKKLNKIMGMTHLILLVVGIINILLLCWVFNSRPQLEVPLKFAWYLCLCVAFRL